MTDKIEFRSTIAGKYMRGSFCAPKIIWHILVIVATMVMSAHPVNAMGEKYSKEGQALAAELDEELIRQGLCKDTPDCFHKLPMYGGHGNKVNFTIYKPDQQVLAVMFQFLVLHGKVITKGVPISVSVFPKSREAYGNKIFTPETVIELEIK